MLSPIAFDLIIKHFDAIDRVVAARLSRKRPWSEPALTSLLCDLLDEETQEDQNLSYTLRQLNEELNSFDGLEMNATLETHEYPPHIEGWVTQSDLGFVVSFNNLMLPDDSWTASWLLQAKRLYPTSKDPVQYDETSRFGGMDKEQHARIEKLVDATGVPFIKYLLYCPRVESLGHVTRQKLRYLHNKSLATHIYDYTFGLQLYNELRKVENSLGAGLLIADPRYLPGTFGVAHSELLKPITPLDWPSVTPLAWFLALQLADECPDIDQQHGLRRSLRLPPTVAPPNHSDLDWVHGIVTGDEEAVERVLELFNDDNERTPEPFLPPHTLTIGVSIGHDLDPEHRQIRLE